MIKQDGKLEIRNTIQLKLTVRCKEFTVDKSDMMTQLDTETRSSKGRKKKRMWREIEAMKDKYQLRKELQDMDMFHDYELSSIDL